MRKNDFRCELPQTDDSDVPMARSIGEILSEYYEKVLGPELMRQWLESKGEKH